MQRTKLDIAACLLALAALLLPACSVNVKKEKNGEDKQVDIQTPVGGIHVSKDANAADTGLAVYPGSHLKPEDSSGDDKSANVNLSGFGFGLKVVALEYESDDPPDKVAAFYHEQLKKYGSNVLECHTSGHLDLDVDMGDKSDTKSRVLTCVGEKGNNIELRVGTRENQHIVAIEPEGKGSSFSLVYVRTHGKQADI
jgi:outer membrane lipopolysaccharide assembly protein LptE/RlpB